MPEQTPINKPEFIIGDLDENVLAKHLEEDIFARPEAYRTVMMIGSIATLSTTVESPVEGDVVKRVRDFFEHRLDLGVTYDDATEEALHHDAEQSQLIKAVQRTRNTEQAKELRDQARHKRFAFFVDRVITWQGQSKSHLRRTG